MTTADTIVAISSAVGPAARMIVRMSGPRAWPITQQLCPDIRLQPASSTATRLHLRGMIVPITVYSFVAPHSYTGQDIIELHLPGNPLLARMIVDEILAQGARSADAGEFTSRAYFNGRIDLAEAEGIAATISAQNEQELRAARQLLAGELARRLQPVMDLLAETLALVEVGIDFVEEEVTFLSAADISQRINDALDALRNLIQETSRFETLSHEPRIVLVGKPNAGKSTLLNALAGRERAVVSAVAGTTRDAISVDIALERGMVRLIDVAGIENAIEPNPSSDADAPHVEISRQMQQIAQSEVEKADLVLLVHDAAGSVPPISIAREADLIVYTKADLLAHSIDGLCVSAHTGQNLGTLRAHMDDLAFGPRGGGASLGLNARHLQAIDESRVALARALDSIPRGHELVAMDLRDSLDALGRILGRTTTDDLLGRIFSAFCIGK